LVVRSPGIFNRTHMSRSEESLNQGKTYCVRCPHPWNPEHPGYHGKWLLARRRRRYTWTWTEFRGNMTT
jgi:hypothetical protein